MKNMNKKASRANREPLSIYFSRELCSSRVSLRFTLPALRSNTGQALITLLFFMVMGITITSAAAVILIANIRASSKVEQGTTAYYIAESGAEEGMLQVVRNPLYNGSETISVDGGVATMSATQGNPITILSVGQYNNFIRKVQIQTVYNNGKITIQSWKEIQ